MSTHPGKQLDELAPYFVAIRKYPLLTREEERALAARVRRGDRAAKQKMIRHNLALVVAVARRQRRGAARLEDLIQEGNIGLMRAVEKFDPAVGTRFSTYATWWIRAFVGRYLQETSSSVRPKGGRISPPDFSLDAPMGDDEDGASFLERLQDDRPGPEDHLHAARADLRVRESLTRIRDRVGSLGWDIIHSRLAQDPPQTLEQIGRRWGVSRERVRQIEAQTKELLQRYLQPANDADADARADDDVWNAA